MDTVLLNSLKELKISNPKFLKSHHQRLVFVLSIFCIFSLIVSLIFIKEDSFCSRGQIILEVLLFLILYLGSLIYDWFEQVRQKRETIDKCLKIINATPDSFYDAVTDCNTPTSDGADLYSVVREGQTMLVASSALVEGDVVIIDEWQSCPASAFLLSAGHVKFAKGDYPARAGRPTHLGESLVEPPEPVAVVLLETPVVTHLMEYISHASKTSTRHVEIEDNFMSRSLLIVALFFTLTRLIYIPSEDVDWVERFLLYPAHTLMPLLPLVYPFWWGLLTYMGTALLLHCRAPKQRVVSMRDSIASDDSLMPQRKLDSYKQLIKLAWRLWLGQAPEYLPRTSNLLHNLSQITVLCCVDKKGVLSYPNATPEKVLVFTPTDDDGTNDEDGFALEVLNLTHDGISPFGVHFDALDWQRHVDSLRPLALSIRLHTCNARTHDQLTRAHGFFAGVGASCAVPTASKRCLCRLADLVGLGEPTLGDFIDTSRHLTGVFSLPPPPPPTTDDCLPQTKLLPSAHASIFTDPSTGYSQLVCEGTADMILDYCTHLWDGRTIHLITEPDRRRIFDFYQRNSSASYCASFSYKPLIDEPPQELLNGSACLQFGQVAFGLHRRHGFLGDITTGSFIDLHGKSSAPTDCGSFQSFFGGQIFLGSVVTQYQARPEVVQLIDNLDSCCIRFVHFSKDNEFRGRVFSEKMGLEAGWNCHISLADASTPPNPAPVTRDPLVRYTPPCGTTRRRSLPDLRTLKQLIRRSHRKKSRSTVASFPKDPPLPDDILLICSDESSDNVTLTGLHAEQLPLIGSDSDALDHLVPNKRRISVRIANEHSSSDSRTLTTMPSVVEAEEFSDWRAQSAANDAFMATLLNQAKLPKGVSSIRPHLASVDNVPLLVHLFTDCTPPATLEMMRIMQENGERVLCVGSSLNMHNMAVFAAADVSIGIEPLLPVVCAARQTQSSTPESEPRFNLGSLLNTLPCALLRDESDPVNIFLLIAQARSIRQSLRCSFLIFVSYSVTLSCISLVCEKLTLPPLIAPPHLLNGAWILAPALAVSVFHSEVDPLVARLATGKRRIGITWKQAVRFGVYFAAAFGPIIAVIALCAVLTIEEVAAEARMQDSSWLSVCAAHPALVVTMQNFAAVQLLVYFVVVSSALIYPHQQLTRRAPFSCRSWILTVMLMLVVVNDVDIGFGWFEPIARIPNRLIYQLLVSALDLTTRQPSPNLVDSTTPTPSTNSTAMTNNEITSNNLQSPWQMLSIIPLTVWMLAACWPLAQLVLCELVKSYQIRVTNTYQKRAKLEFGTKLGMNSPF